MNCNSKKTRTFMKRLTAILVAVVFVLGTMLTPVELFAVESDAQAATDAEAQDAQQTSVDETQDADVDGAQDAVSEAEGDEMQSEEETPAEEAQGEEVSERDDSGSADLSDLVVVNDEDGNAIDLNELSEDAYDGFIYKVEDDASKKEIKKMENAIDDLDSNQEVEEVMEKELYTADSIETIEEVANEKIVEYIEPNYILKACGVPNDPYYPSFAWEMNLMDVPYVWDRGMTGNGAIVAILDSGVNTNHVDFAGTKFVKKYNVWNETTSVTDVLGHGTCVAGVVAGARNNKTGFTGAMSKATIMPVKVLNDSGATSVAMLTKAIRYAVNNKADVINMSLGGNFDGGASVTLESYCKAATDAGVIMVAAAGNEAQEGNPIEYPAAYNCVVSVGSVDRDKEWSFFSNYNNQITVAAPGEDVMLMIGSRDYVAASGTSFAAPQVSALAAMIKSRNHGLAPATFMQLLASTSTDLGTPGYDPKYGYGLINYKGIFDYMKARFGYYSYSISTSQYVYNGAVKTPSTTLSLGTVKLVKGTDYAVSYSAGRKAVGTYKVTVTGKNAYSGTKVASFKIIPPLVRGIKSPKRGKKKLTVRWKAMSQDQLKQYKGGITGYQVRVSRNSNFSGAKYKKVKGAAKTSVTVKGLKKKKRYYVQYRAYKNVGSTTYYSKWSSIKKAKTK